MSQNPENSPIAVKEPLYPGAPPWVALCDISTLEKNGTEFTLVKDYNGYLMKVVLKLSQEQFAALLKLVGGVAP